jgi:hypothetical protein
MCSVVRVRGPMVHIGARIAGRRDLDGGNEDWTTPLLGNENCCWIFLARPPHHQTHLIALQWLCRALRCPTD